MQVNHFAIERLGSVLLERMSREGHGWVLVPVAASGRAAFGLLPGHFASKAALWTWAESAARALDGSGVVVTLFSPPRMASGLLRESLRPLLRRYHVEELSEFAVEDVPAHLQVAVERE